MIDFLVKPLFLRREIANKIRFDLCLKNRYPEILSNARDFCTVIRESIEYKEAKNAYTAYKDAEYHWLACYCGDRSEDGWKRKLYLEKMSSFSKVLVEKWKSLDSRFSILSLEDTYRNLVQEVKHRTSYDPKSIMLYSDHKHYGYDKDKKWQYVGSCGYSEEYFIEYCTIYDLMCLIGDYCYWSDCDGLERLKTDDYLYSPYSDVNSVKTEEVYKKAREELFGFYDIEGDDRQMEKLNKIVSKLNSF